MRYISVNQMTVQFFFQCFFFLKLFSKRSIESSMGDEYDLMVFGAKDNCSYLISHRWENQRRWCLGRLSYGPECLCLVKLNLVLCCELPLRSLFLLYWYRWINGTSFVVEVERFTSKSSFLLSSALSFSSIACIVNSLLILPDVDAPAARAGISTLDFVRSSSSCGKLFRAVNLNLLNTKFHTFYRCMYRLHTHISNVFCHSDDHISATN